MHTLCGIKEVHIKKTVGRSRLTLLLAKRDLVLNWTEIYQFRKNMSNDLLAKRVIKANYPRIKRSPPEHTCTAAEFYTKGI
jgi:hypothetical protein